MSSLNKKIALGFLSIALLFPVFYTNTTSDKNTSPENTLSYACDVLNNNLISAIQAFDFESVKVLLNWGANVNATSALVYTALGEAIISSTLSLSEEIARALKPVNINERKKNRLKIIKELLKNNANVNEKDEDGYTALILAAKYKMFDIVADLLIYGAKENIADDLNNLVEGYPNNRWTISKEMFTYIENFKATLDSIENKNNMELERNLLSIQDYKNILLNLQEKSVKNLIIMALINPNLEKLLPTDYSHLLKIYRDLKSGNNSENLLSNLRNYIENNIINENLKLIGLDTISKVEALQEGFRVFPLELATNIYEYIQTF